MKEIFNVGIIGCGDISRKAYIPNIVTRYKNLNLYALADLQRDRAEKLAEEYKVKKVMSPDEILVDPEVDVVLNLTNPMAHYELNMKILKAGKHLYSEKPLALNYKEAKEIVDLAKEKGLYVGCAPDVFLGAGVQTMKKVLDSGIIGEILSSKVANMYHGNEVFHPEPDYYYKKGAGPMLDIGPYGLHEMILFMGPVEEVFCYGGVGFNPRPIKDHFTDVEVYTNYNGCVKFRSGATGSVNFSWDVWGAEFGSAVQIYGTKGSVFLTDPDNYSEGCKVHMLLSEDLNGEDGKIDLDKSWHAGDYKKDVPNIFPSPRDNRGIGLCEMVEAIKEGRKALDNADFVLHLTELLDAFNISIATGKPYKMQSTFEPTGRLPEDFYEKMMSK